MPLIKSHLPQTSFLGSDPCMGVILPTSFMAIPHSPTSPLPKSYPTEALGKDAPWVLNSSPWGCTPSCDPWPDLLVRMGR